MPQKNKHFEIRDTRNGSWYWVNTAVNACPHVTAYDKVVYGSLCSFFGCKEIRPSFDEIARRASVSTRKAKKSIKKLLEVKYIQIEKGGGRGKCNVYKLLKASKGCTLCTVSKRCTLRPKSDKTVHATTINGARRAPQYNKELYNKNYIDHADGFFEKKAAASEIKEKPKSDHKQFIEFWHETVQAARGIKPVYTGADYQNLKRILNLKILNQNQLQQLAAYYLGSWNYRQFSPSISTFLSAGIINGLMNKMSNDPEFWRTLNETTQKYVRPIDSQTPINQQDSIHIRECLAKLKTELSAKLG